MATTADYPSGYRPCACRDCMETAIGPIGAMCHDCADAGCDAFYTECRSPHSYGGAECTHDGGTRGGICDTCGAEV